ncbi:diguanylate cyclase [Myxococcus sp. CA051A]|uniref:diguanylate cyclase n=1 Tax=Myxococcus llanfairpwllgwyngyllgogerychwyrndrobwllllantysiliogogogochensis TaxID=2590453 RepID=A0A540WM69_9BACT|nr:MULTISPECIES: diguanylate cyclase [Myxococcus]NTX36811.1 diguanylate cyclase [Myxococcus sp. CA033]NTX62550.1 diguanylate cyclase [Myxococcus sp. CA051A]TQF09514.1 diguanylate cyclase [Myxococcus llanfairpwllgwyngyllgogerychwyrndrobwllllantysiliogogogochensis]
MTSLSAFPSPGRLLRHVVRLLPTVAGLSTFLHLARGGFRGLHTLGWTEAGLVLFLLVGIAVAAWRRAMRGSVGAVIDLRDDLELGGGLVAAGFIVVAIGGGELFPIVYLLMAFLVAFLPRNAGLTLLGVALVFDALVTLGGPVPNAASFATHSAFLVLFAGLYHLVLASRIAVARRAENDAVQKRIREVEERARTFRLVSSGTADSFSGMSSDEKWLVASVKEIEGAVHAALEIAETGLRTHTCAAFLLASDDRSLKLYDCRSGSERVQRERFGAGEGIIGGVLKRRAPVRMNSAQGLKGVTYYEGGGPNVQALLAVPIIEGSGLVRGVLVADRLSHEPFSDQDEKLLSTIAGEVLRSIEVERVMSYIRKTRDEKDRFFKAIEELNRAGSPEQVFVAVLESTRQLASLDFCAVTLVSEVDGKRMHRVARMTGVTAHGKALEGRSFADNNGLVANVVRYGAPLPGRDLKAMDRQVIFDDETQIRGLGALKIFPLVAGDRILGTLVAGSRKKANFEQDVLRMIEVIAIQAAQAVLRAQLYEQMERMATTDGLTGLFNHRTFQAKADEILAQARRYQRKCSVVLTDVDHFKSVNDTYGHPTGDQVLKGVARIIKSMARDTDVVARYGGEEFVIIMPETDAKGAFTISERIREAVKAEVFQTEMGPLRITMSLGIATFPDHGMEKQQLIDLADQCLYHSKRNGRNQSVTVAQMQGGRKLQAVEAS